MKWFNASVLIVAVAGCTTLRPIDGTPIELQQLINSGELQQPGDRVRIVTEDQKAHRFAITKIGAGLMEGPTESIPVDRVMSLEVGNVKTSLSNRFDTRAVTDYLIAIAAFALRPITVDSTPAKD